MGENLAKLERDTLLSDVDSQAFNLAMTNKTQVNKVISSLRNTKCRDVYQFYKFLKTHKGTLAPVISHLTNS